MESGDSTSKMPRRRRTKAEIEAARRRHAKYVQTTYGLAEGDYERLYLAQGERCFICLRARGTTKRLAVDHCHKSGRARGLLCGPCNKMIGHGRDDPEFFMRAYEYLRNPPAWRIGIIAIHKDNRAA